MLGLVKLDLGCGDNPADGFIGVDIIKFPKTQIVHDLRTPWPWPDNSVDEARSSHFIEHLKSMERWFFFNELYRVLKPDAKALIVAPHCFAGRAYGDMTHEWPPVSEFFFNYLYRPWRMGDPERLLPPPNTGMAANAPHDDVKYRADGLSCNFEFQVGGSLHPSLLSKHQDVQQFAIANYKEAFQDLIATLTAKK